MMRWKALWLLAGLLAGLSLFIAGSDARPSGAPDAWAFSSVPLTQEQHPVVGPAKPARLSEAEAEDLFRRILSGLRREYLLSIGQIGCGTRGPWLSEDWRSGRPKARLFARAYPDLAKRLILETLEDPESPVIDRKFACQVADALPDWTTDRLEALLKAEVEKREDYYYLTALETLSQRDRGLRHRDLYRSLCREGAASAFQILSCTPHPGATEFFEELKRLPRKREHPLGEIPEDAGKALERLQILNSPDGGRIIEAMVRKPVLNEHAFEDMDAFLWACAAARRRGLPKLLDALAERGRRKPSERSYGDAPNMALSMFAEFGGALAPDEFPRFRRNGFVGDAEERLLEIVAEEGLR